MGSPTPDLLNLRLRSGPNSLRTLDKPPLTLVKFENPLGRGHPDKNRIGCRWLTDRCLLLSSCKVVPSFSPRKQAMSSGSCQGLSDTRRCQLTVGRSTRTHPSPSKSLKADISGCFHGHRAFRRESLNVRVSRGQRAVFSVGSPPTTREKNDSQEWSQGAGKILVGGWGSFFADEPACFVVPWFPLPAT